MAGRGAVAEVRLWGAPIGAVSWDPARALGAFEYTRRFRSSGIEVAPLLLPLGSRIYDFPALVRTSFHGLPGLVADSLPDRFGHRVIDAWLARTGRSPDEFSPIDRLLYIGSRGMGALTYHPARSGRAGSLPLEVDELVGLANEVLAERRDFRVDLAADGDQRHEAMRSILLVGVSAGGARAKAIVAWNPDTNEVRSGQVDAPAGFGYWLIKFDGVTGGIASGPDGSTLAGPRGYGLVEYAYAQMARAAGIEMSECRLLRENGRSHFLTRRFDRTEAGGRRHMLSLCALAHLDFEEAGAHAYEQAFGVIERLGLGKAAIEELLRRMAFNVAARNQDDHTKNISFLMDRRGGWSLAPAYDLNLAYNPAGRWTNRHQMSVNGKREGITRNDLLAVAERFRVTRPRALRILDEVARALDRWPELAEEVGVAPERIARIAALHRRIGRS